MIIELLLLFSLLIGALFYSGRKELGITAGLLLIVLSMFILATGIQLPAGTTAYSDWCVIPPGTACVYTTTVYADAVLSLGGLSFTAILGMATLLIGLWAAYANLMLFVKH